MNWDAIKPLLTLLFTSVMKIAGGALVAHGVLTAGSGLETFMGAASMAGGAFWSWWVQSGHLQAAALLKKLTDTRTQDDAIAVAKQMKPAIVTGAAVTAKVDAAAAAKIAAVVAVLLLGAITMPTPGYAQGKIDLDPLGLTTKKSQSAATPSKDLQALWTKIVTASNADLAYASALAGSANTASSKVRKQCWDAIVALNDQANGLNLKNPDGTPMVKPEPHLFTDVESLAEVIDNLSPQGPLFTACAGAAQLAKANTLQFISAVIAGAAGMAALPAGL